MIEDLPDHVIGIRITDKLRAEDYERQLIPLINAKLEKHRKLDFLCCIDGEWKGTGGLPNGSGLEFAPPGGTDAGANLRAASVIWEWTEVNRREVTWPPQFATAPIATLRPTR